jgi:hypothetical protein
MASLLQRAGQAVAHQLFGYAFPDEDTDDKRQTFSPKIEDDGAMVVAPNTTAASYIDFSGGTFNNETDLINKYRNMAMQPEIDEAVKQICNDAIISQNGEKTVSIILDDVDLTDPRKKKIEEQFKTVLKLLEFHNRGYDTFQRWYVDGRLYFHAVIDADAPKEGIKEMRYIDPRQMRKVRVTAKRRDSKVPTVIVPKVVEEFFAYSLDKATGSKNTTQSPFSPKQAVTAIKVAKDSIVHITSGITDEDGTLVIGELHKAIKVLNVLKQMEDAQVIHRITRAPDRRAFYIDVGELARGKVDQYIKDVAIKHKNKLRYDTTTGEMRDDRNYVTAVEDYYFPRREGKGTEIENINGLANTQAVDDLEYFGKKLMRALNVPVSRLDPENAFNIGRSSQISRDELLFARFIDRLRNKFSDLLLQTLGKQLILTNFCNADEWEEIKGDIQFKYLADNLTDELKDQEMLMERLNALNAAEPYRGKFFSAKWMRQHILRQSESDIAQIDEDIAEEATNPQYSPPVTGPDMGDDDEDGGNEPPDDGGFDPATGAETAAPLNPFPKPPDQENQVDKQQAPGNPGRPKPLPGGKPETNK